MAPQEIHIFIRWAGEQGLFGVRETVEQHDDEDDKSWSRTTTRSRA